MSDADALLAAVAADPGADLPRLVYADFLDDRGDADRAELVRLDCHLVAHPADDAALKRFRDLSSAADPGWLARFVRPAVARCGLRFEYACPKRWADLTATADPAVRHCDWCHKLVYLSTDRATALRRAAADECVAVDRRLVDPTELADEGTYELLGDIAMDDLDNVRDELELADSDLDDSRSHP